MESLKYPLFYSINQKFASSRIGAWLYSRTLHHFDRFFLFLTRGRTTLTGLVAGLPVVMVTIIGAKSGRSRDIPLLCIPDAQDGKSFGLIASNFGKAHHPAWYFNLKANPKVTCSFKGHTGEYIAREVTGADYDRIWEQACSIYLGYPLYKQRVGKRRIHIMLMTAANS